MLYELDILSKIASYVELGDAQGKLKGAAWASAFYFILFFGLSG